MFTYPQDVLFAGFTTPGTLTPDMVQQMYQRWLKRPPTASELASELDNGTRYGPAGIEREIANRGGNVAGSGVRGDEGQPSLTVQPPPPAVSNGNLVTMGPAALPPPGGYSASGPTGLAPGYYGGPVAPGGVIPNAPASAYAAVPVATGFSSTMLLILAAAAAAALYFLVVRKA